MKSAQRKPRKITDFPWLSGDAAWETYLFSAHRHSPHLARQRRKRFNALDLALKDSMEVMSLISRLSLAFLFLTFAACKEPDPSVVFLENATADKLQVIVGFDGADTASKPLTFQLDPGQQDGWRFIPDKKEAEHFDSSFRSLLI